MEVSPENLELLKYPIGRFVAPAELSADQFKEYITAIAEFPVRLRKEIAGLSDEQLDTPYRPGGWSVRQVVHHCADSHMNGLTRFKLALTEERPIIKPYREDLFAELADSQILPEVSLDLLTGIHSRWITLLKSMTPDNFKRTYVHPEYGKDFSLREATSLYAWHCDHHLAHITNLKKIKRW